MMELLDTQPMIDVDNAEYARLLGYPRGHVVAGRASELMAWARDWYAQQGRPWIYARQCRSLEIVPGRVCLDGAAFSSVRVEQMLSVAQADGAFIVAVSAGAEIETHAQHLWRSDRPDEYFFLEIYASSVVEYLTTIMGARLCAWADQNKLAVLPHYSPGYPEWDISQQAQLLQLILGGAQKALPQQLDVLPSGMLRPKKSLLAVFGITANTQSVQRLTALNPCQNCSYARCEFRRAPYARGQSAELEVAAATGESARLAVPPAAPAVKYSVNPRALTRWAAERVTLTPNADGTTDAIFRYDGTTCSNMGRPLAYEYHVKLGRAAAGYVLQEMRCAPVPGDQGYTFMCRYISHRETLMAAIADEKPLLGRPLADVFHWTRTPAGAGCYCELTSRLHKWGLALETIHFALAQREAGAAKG